MRHRRITDLTEFNCRVIAIVEVEQDVASSGLRHLVAVHIANVVNVVLNPFSKWQRIWVVWLFPSFIFSDHLLKELTQLTRFGRVFGVGKESFDVRKLPSGQLAITRILKRRHRPKIAFPRSCGWRRRINVLPDNDRHGNDQCQSK